MSQEIKINSELSRVTRTYIVTTLHFAFLLSNLLSGVKRRIAQKGSVVQRSGQENAKISRHRDEARKRDRTEREFLRVSHR